MAISAVLELIPLVALRKESVDRNVFKSRFHYFDLSVALRKESVDRNARKIRPVAPDISSLSARRAWIEILNGAISNVWAFVALRKESVDRNWNPAHTGVASCVVALRKESVDRNVSAFDVLAIDAGRSPQGERG